MFKILWVEILISRITFFLTYIYIIWSEVQNYLSIQIRFEEKKKKEREKKFQSSNLDWIITNLSLEKKNWLYIDSEFFSSRKCFGLNIKAFKPN